MVDQTTSCKIGHKHNHEDDPQRSGNKAQNIIILPKKKTKKQLKGVVEHLARLLSPPLWVHLAAGLKVYNMAMELMGLEWGRKLRAAGTKGITPYSRVHVLFSFVIST